jgi:hypothetical protein
MSTTCIQSALYTPQTFVTANATATADDTVFAGQRRNA